jgi:glycosyltransferase involved in cell wall biosynthesis
MTDRRRIAVYYNVGWGGGRRWLYECVSRLSEYHDLDLYCVDRAPDEPHYPDATEFAEHAYTVPFSDLPKRSGLLKPLKGAQMWADLYRFDRASKAVAERIDAGNYDLMFASVGGYTEAPLPLRHARTRSAYYCHEPMRLLYEPPVPRAYDRSPLRRLWHRAFYGTIVKGWDREGTRKASLVLTNSKYCRDYTYRAYGVDSVVNYPGVDVDAFRPGDEERERFVLTVGEQLPTKGFDWSIRAVGAIPEAKRPPLVWVGNRTQGPEEAYLRSVAAECGVRLDMRERLPDPELKRLFRTASAFIYTPHLEPFGLAAVEAMASGTPVVAVREAGPAETVVDGETGFLRERDPAQLGEALLRLLDDAALRERMGAAGREHVVANFTWDRSVEQLAQLLGEAAVAESTHSAVTRQASAVVVK